jgi:hypothetical protein
MSPQNGHVAPPAETLHLPAPTAWPMVLALGITLAFAGLITYATLSAVGIVLTLIAGVGWWREVLPVHRVEEIALSPVDVRTQVVVPPPPAVFRARVGDGGHRTRVPVEVPPYSAGIKGGVAGGLVMAVLAVAYGLIVQRSPWYPINLLSAVAVPSLAQASVEELRAFSLVALALGTVVHGVISVIVGLLYAVIHPMLPRRHMLWGGLVAPLLWTGLAWAVLGIVNPALNARVDWAWFVLCQIAFGLTTGLVVARARPLATMQTWPLAARAGVESSEREEHR